MLTVTLISIAVIVFAGTLGGALWLVFYIRRSARTQKIAKKAATAQGPAFRWSYVALPIAVLLLSVLLAVYFYHQLPTEVATHFELDGTPDRWLSRQMTMVWVLAPQFFLTLVAIGATWGITKIGFLFKSAADTWVKPEQILLFMGNAIALPQLVLSFAMLDIFSYNSYQQHLMPMWLFLLIILGLATIVLGVLSVLLILKAKRQITPQANQTKE